MPVVESGAGGPGPDGSFGMGGGDDFFGGDVSSIMIKPDMINDNIAEGEEL